MTKQDELDQKERERLDKKELARLKAFTAQLAQDAAAAIISISPDEWEQAQAQDIEENAKRLATARQ